MKIVITGASGLLGINFTLAAAQKAGSVTAVYFRHPVDVPGVDGVRLDLVDGEGVDSLMDRIRPDWIVHCAAITDVDWCEDHPEAAREFNVGVSRRLAAAARRVGGRMLYVSTDAVFDGERGGYAEGDRCEPVNHYARTKLEGEAAVRAALPGALVVRTNMFGWKLEGRPGLAEWVLQRLIANEPVPGFSDVIFTPLLVNDLSEIMLDMMQGRLSGVYHAGSKAPCSKYEFARLVARAFGLREDLVYPAAVRQSGLRARRPRNTSLRSDKAVTALGRPMPGLEASVRRFRALRDGGFTDRLKRLRGGSSDEKV